MEEAAHYPVFLDLRGRLAVVVGAGPVAERRARSLARHGADVVVIAPEPSEGLREMEAEGRLTLEEREYSPGDLRNAVIVYCASEDPAVRESVFREADTLGTLVASADPEAGNFVVPSVLRRGSLLVAVSTGGVSPELVRRVKRDLVATLGAEWAEFAELLGAVRKLANERVAHADEREALLERLAADDTVLARLAAGETVDPEVVFRGLTGEGD